jgi:hypothetical protein
MSKDVRERRLSMTTFDFSDVRNFADDLNARMTRCDNGEGLECATLDAMLKHYADLCCRFVEAVRSWGRGVFQGTIAFDPKVEQLFKEEGDKLFSRASEVFILGQNAEIPCFELDGQPGLQSALWRLGYLLADWVTPRLAVNPATRNRHELSEAELNESRSHLKALNPLPADWKPTDEKLRKLFERLNYSKSKIESRP